MGTRATVSLTLSCTETELSASLPDVSPRQGQAFKGMPCLSLEPLHCSKFCSHMLCFETPIRALYEPLNANLDALYRIFISSHAAGLGARHGSEFTGTLN
jgi:hypothetical protein